jgi:hypothetical protein
MKTKDIAYYLVNDALKTERYAREQIRTSAEWLKRKLDSVLADVADQTRGTICPSVAGLAVDIEAQAAALRIAHDAVRGAIRLAVEVDPDAKAAAAVVAFVAGMVLADSNIKKSLDDQLAGNQTARANAASWGKRKSR